MTKITKRFVYEQLIALAETGKMELTEDQLKAFAENEIVQLDKKAAKAKEKAAEKKADGDALRDTVEAILTDEFQTVADVSAQIEGEDVTVGKIRNRLSELVRMGVAEKATVSVDVDGKSAQRMAYKRAANA